MPFIFKEGDPKAQCDRCGFSWNLSKLRKEWTNLMVCPKCYTPRHPLDFMRGIEDKQAVPNSRHVQTMDEITFIDVPTIPDP